MNAVTLALRARTFRSVRKHRNFRLFLAGQLVSTAGTWMQHIALVWLVIDISHSPVAVGAVTFFRLLPLTVLGPLAGVVIDRRDTRRLLIAVQAAAAAVSVALGVATLTGTPVLWVVYLLAALSGAVLSFDAPGRNALTYELVGPRELPNAVALNSGLFNATRIVGPAIAGLVIAFAGVAACFLVNAATFAAVLLSLGLMRKAAFFPTTKDRSVRLVAGMQEAIAHVRAHPETRAVLIVLATVSTVGFNFHVLVPLLATDTLNVGPQEFGLLSAVFGAGALVGALISATMRRATFTSFAAGAAGFGLLLIVLAPMRNTVIVGGVLFALGCCFALFTTNANALVQLGAPDRLRGRLVSLYLLAFAGLAPVGGLLAGWLTEIGGTQLAFGLGGGIGLVAVTCSAPWRYRSV